MCPLKGEGYILRAAPSPEITERMLHEPELCGFFDLHSALLNADGAEPWVLIYQDCAQARVWEEVEIDLPPWKGRTVRIRFHFEVFDPMKNDGVGWLVDNVRIESGDCLASNYCIAAPNSVSQSGASMGHTGTLQVQNNDFTLTLDGEPPGEFGLFFFGPFARQTPLAGGYLCVGSDVFGYRRLFPTRQIDTAGQMLTQVDFTTLNGYQTILPGTNWKFQCWYRDHVGGVSTSNFSDGLSVTFCE